MENHNILLSICIPTYNRGEILQETLNNLVSDKHFDDEVEIVVSDNASTDNTRTICENYSKKYNRFVYYRNEKNVQIYNFYQVLCLAHGKYLKLVNDTCVFRNDILGQIKETIRNSDETHALLFPSISYFVKAKKHIVSENINDTLKYLSYNATWSPTFGIWKRDFNAICDNTDYETLMPQVDWIYRISLKKKIDLHYDRYFDVQWTGSKGNYNYMKTFAVNYLDMLKKYDFSFWRIEVEKFRLLYILISIYKKMVVGKKVSYSRENALRILFRVYWNEPYFYFLFPVFFVFRVLYEDLLKIILFKFRNKPYSVINS